MLGTVEIHANALKSRMHKCLSIIHACTTILTTDANLITDAKIIHPLYAPSNSVNLPYQQSATTRQEARLSTISYQEATISTISY